MAAAHSRSSVVSFSIEWNCLISFLGGSVYTSFNAEGVAFNLNDGAGTTGLTDFPKAWPDRFVEELSPSQLTPLFDYAQLSDIILYI